MQEIRFLRIREVVESTSQCKGKIYSGVKAEIFPPPVKIGKTTVWLESEINEWKKAVISGLSEPDMKACIANIKANRPAIGL
ncbi:MAG: AlpA family phage regulatory protein [Alistipes senegalensis]|nr:AlpA family phage regulatory protein [Oxalobacter formigenes]MCM1280738.1 AlpA family phage regulatory protein [Alistipes senegalensis]